MPKITIVGLGPHDSQCWTVAAQHHLSQVEEVYLRTARHPSVADISAKTHSFDDWYEQASDFNELYDRVATEIVRLGQRPTGVTYAVPGHPHVGEATVPRIMDLAEAQQLPVKIIHGLSFIEPTLTALKLNGLNNLQIADAIEIAHLYHPPLNPDRPALVARLYGQAIAQRVQATLLNAYRPDDTITLIRAAGSATERVWSCRLAELADQPDLDDWTTLYLPANPLNNSLVTFQETIAHLRSPDGCPWDKVQTHQSLRPYLLEETYEVLETLDANDTPALAEELGDLLLQIVLHTQIATQNGEFNMGEVIGQINRKMLRRHPHVFGDVVIQGVAELGPLWSAIKQAEKAEKGKLPQVISALDGVPIGLPALAQALAIAKKAVRAGFEWDNIEGVLSKVIEEAREVAEATEPSHVEAEIGDLLFSIVNLARWRKIDPESALRSMNVRFTRRFQTVEALVAAQGKVLSEMSLAEMLAVWNEAKRLLA